MAAVPNLLRIHDTNGRFLSHVPRNIIRGELPPRGGFVNKVAFSDWIFSSVMHPIVKPEAKDRDVKFIRLPAGLRLYRVSNLRPDAGTYWFTLNYRDAVEGYSAVFGMMPGEYVLMRDVDLMNMHDVRTRQALIRLATPEVRSAIEQCFASDVDKEECYRISEAVPDGVLAKWLCQNRYPGFISRAVRKSASSAAAAASSSSYVPAELDFTMLLAPPPLAVEAHQDSHYFHAEVMMCDYTLVTKVDFRLNEDELLPARLPPKIRGLRHAQSPLSFRQSKRRAPLFASGDDTGAKESPRKRLTLDFDAVAASEGSESPPPRSPVASSPFGSGPLATPPRPSRRKLSLFSTPSP